MTDCSARESNFSEASFSESKFKKTVLKDCEFTRADFMHADLNGMDFSDCGIDGAFFQLDRLKGITVSYEQAVSLAKLLGIKVK